MTGGTVFSSKYLKNLQTTEIQVEIQAMIEQGKDHKVQGQVTVREHALDLLENT